MRRNKLTPEDRQTIRDLYLQRVPVKDIAARYGVAPSAISYHCTDIDRTAECGTNAGYSRHYTLRTRPCDPCKKAHAAYCHEWKAAS